MSAEEAEDYQDIISTPMDFSTMQSKFKSLQYRSPQDFVEDMKLVFSNAEEYNQPGSTVLQCMSRTEQTFTELLHKILPGVTYLRRKARKRNTPQQDDDEDDEEDEKRGRKMQNGKQESSASKGREESSSRSAKHSGRRCRQVESESEDEDEEDRVTRRSKRTAALSSRKDYREQDSDSERENRRTGLRKSGRRAGDDAEASSDDESIGQRHSKRQKRSL